MFYPINRYFFWLVFFLFLSIGCSDNNLTLRLVGKTMGTDYHIQIIPPVNKATTRSKQYLQTEIDKLLDSINHSMSTYLPNSEVSLFNLYPKTDWFPISEKLYQVIAAAQKISRQTRGAFDITVSPLVDLWGFGASTRLEIPSDSQINEALRHVGYNKLQLRHNPPALRKQDSKLQIDLSAIAKGFAVDHISHYLQQSGYENYLVEIGGEIRVAGNKASGQAWQLAIESPDRTQTKAIINKVIQVRDTGLATSGDYRNYYIKSGRRYAHTINPVTGRPVTHRLASVTVIHPSAMIADALATALMVLGEEQGWIFAKMNALRVNMIIRSQNGFITKTNLLGKLEKVKN